MGSGGRRLGEADKDHHAVAAGVGRVAAHALFVVDEVGLPVVANPDVARLVDLHAGGAHVRDVAGRRAGTVQRIAAGQRHRLAVRRQGVARAGAEVLASQLEGLRGARRWSRRVAFPRRAGPAQLAQSTAKLGAGMQRAEVGDPQIAVAVQAAAPRAIDAAAGVVMRGPVRLDGVDQAVAARAGPDDAVAVDHHALHHLAQRPALRQAERGPRQGDQRQRAHRRGTGDPGRRAVGGVDTGQPEGAEVQLRTGGMRQRKIGGAARAVVEQHRDAAAFIVRAPQIALRVGHDRLGALRQRLFVPLEWRRVVIAQPDAGVGVELRGAVSGLFEFQRVAPAEIAVPDLILPDPDPEARPQQARAGDDRARPVAARGRAAVGVEADRILRGVGTALDDVVGDPGHAIGIEGHVAGSAVGIQRRPGGVDLHAEGPRRRRRLQRARIGRDAGAERKNAVAAQRRVGGDPLQRRGGGTRSVAGQLQQVAQGVGIGIASRQQIGERAQGA